MKSPFIQQVFLIAYYVPAPGLIVKVHGEDSAVPALCRDDEGHTQEGDSTVEQSWLLIGSGIRGGTCTCRGSELGRAERDWPGWLWRWEKTAVGPRPSTWSPVSHMGDSRLHPKGDVWPHVPVCLSHVVAVVPM